MRRAVLNRLINEEQAEQGDGGYLTRLSKGQLECRTELADLAERCDVTITEVRLVFLVHRIHFVHFIVTYSSPRFRSSACACTSRCAAGHHPYAHIHIPSGAALRHGGARAARSACHGECNVRRRRQEGLRSRAEDWACMQTSGTVAPRWGCLEEVS